MNSRGMIRILAMLLGIVSLFMVPSLVMALLEDEGRTIFAFAMPIACAVFAALIAYLVGKGRAALDIRPRHGFLLVGGGWTAVGLFGCLPFFISGYIPSFTNALFESVSGFTTTGASILADIEALPRSLLFWRAMTHWLGGMGIVVLTVALLPLLGVGAFQLLKAETPGPEKDRITPKITSTAKILWLIYLFLTLFQTILLMFGGLDWFDAITHAFATMATGGFSTRNASIAAFDSAWVEGVCTVFMVLAGVNFALYFRLLSGKIVDLWRNTELKVYVGIFFIITLFITLNLLPDMDGFARSFRYASFQAASILTTTGFVSADYDLWPELAKFFIFLLMFIGGCSGSTGGGVKVIRHVVLFKQAGNEMRRLLHPRGVFSVRLNSKVGRKDVVYGVAGFIIMYLALVMLVTMASAASGSDLMTSLSASLATVGNIGPGFGGVGPTLNYLAYPGWMKWVFSFAMIAGRLELWTILILFKPEYWRR